MDLLDLLTLFASIIVSAAYICRLAALNWRMHRASVILMHAGLGAASMLAGIHAYVDNTDVQDIAILVGAAALIVLSLHSWGDGHVPKQFRTEPVPLDEATTVAME